MKHKFARGFFVGSLMTIGAVAGSVFAFRKIISNLLKPRLTKSTKIGAKPIVNVFRPTKAKPLIDHFYQKSNRLERLLFLLSMYGLIISRTFFDFA